MHILNLNDNALRYNVSHNNFDELTSAPSL